MLYELMQLSYKLMYELQEIIILITNIIINCSVIFLVPFSHILTIASGPSLVYTRLAPTMSTPKCVEESCKKQVGLEDWEEDVAQGRSGAKRKAVESRMRGQCLGQPPRGLTANASVDLFPYLGWPSGYLNLIF